MTSKNSLVAFILGLLIGGGAVYVGTMDMHNSHSHGDTHPIGYADSADQVHVHSDFLVIVDGEQIDFTADKYQTTSEQELAEDIHLHDNVGHVIHRHADDVTLGEFFDSFGYTLTNDCFTQSDSLENCSDENELLVFVNDERIDNPSEYINQEEDRILIYYGDPNDNELIRASLLTITDEACIYSGTCPERGIAPAESCGLTCDI